MYYIKAEHEEFSHDFRAFEVSFLGGGKVVARFEGNPVDAWEALTKWQLDNDAREATLSSTVDHLSMDIPNLGWGMKEFEHNGNVYEGEMLIWIDEEEEEGD